MQDENSQNRGWEAPGRFVPAAVLIVIGTLFLLSNLHVIPDVNWFDFWPVILIAAGIYRLVDGGPRMHVGGAILVVVGSLLLANNLGYLAVSVWSLWPLALIAVGVWMLLERMPHAPRRSDARAHFEQRFAGTPAPEGGFTISCVFSGSKRQVSEDFRGAAIHCAFGGAELDLRNAIMLRSPATIYADCLFGGAEIRIPREWLVDVQGTGAFGGVSDETTHPAAIARETPRLVVKGSALFGGVVVKN